MTDASPESAQDTSPEARPETDAQTGTTGTGAPEFIPARRSRAAWILFILTALIGLAIDLVSKYLAFAYVAGSPVRFTRDQVVAARDLDTLIPDHAPVNIIPGLLDFTLVLNPGAVFGIGAGKRWFFVVFTLLALGLATVMFGSWTHARDRLSHVSIGLLVAGGIGNLYDRLIYACVRDFIHPLPDSTLPFGLTWPNGSTAVWPYVSNIADLFLLVGIGVLLVMSLFGPKPQPSPPDNAKPAS